jgi:hypothetical protein
LKKLQKDARQEYEDDVRKRLEEQDKQINPQKYEYTKSFKEKVEENTIPGQAVKSRRELQKGREHMTPQGMVKFGDDGNDQPTNTI